MGCHCDYDDAPSVYDVRTRTAKKEHKCSECRGVIKPGEVYERAWGVWDGDIRAFKACPDCLELRRWAQAHVKCICWSHGDTHSIAVETLDEYELDCPGLGDEVRAKIAEIRAKRRAWPELEKEGVIMGAVADAVRAADRQLALLRRALQRRARNK